jgi:hypothetical protein
MRAVPVLRHDPLKVLRTPGKAGVHQLEFEGSLDHWDQFLRVDFGGKPGQGGPDPSGRVGRLLPGFRRVQPTRRKSAQAIQQRITIQCPDGKEDLQRANGRGSDVLVERGVFDQALDAAPTMRMLGTGWPSMRAACDWRVGSRRRWAMRTGSFTLNPARTPTIASTSAGRSSPMAP